MDDQPKIRVVVRKRPLTRKEQSLREQDVVEVRDGTTVVVREMKEKVDLTKFMDHHHFTFDNAFDEAADNSKIYWECVRPIVQSAFHGARVTCFAYGQTGSGKTYTMNGDPQRNVAGMYVLAAHDIFTLRQDARYRHLQVSMSFYEIYCGKLFDLLNGRSVLPIRYDAKQNVNVIGLTERRIQTVQEYMQIIASGGAVRVTSQNSTNADSSRSHAILQITLLEGKKVHGKISFIDLAGCERGADTMEQNKQTRIDGAEINKSLLALKECIRALDNGKTHTPFRGSKLTMVLKDSFTGFCRTLMIGNISPNESACENTLNTLRYADRVKELRRGNGEPLSREDALAKELMLPRMNKNKQTTYMSEDESGDESQGRLFQEAAVRHSTHNGSSQMDEERQSTYRGSLPNRNIKPAIIYEEAENLNTNRVMSRISLDNKNNQNKPDRRLSQALNQSMQGINGVKNGYRSVEQPPLAPHNLPASTLNLAGNTEPISSNDHSYWEQLLEYFRMWEPHTRSYVVRMAGRLEYMAGLLRREESEVIAAHQAELQYGYDTFNNSLDLCNSTSNNPTKSIEQLKHYPAMISPYVEKKMSLLCNFKAKLDSFNLHMKEHEECTYRLQDAQQHISREEDEVSLLDEVQEYYYLFFRNQNSQNSSGHQHQQPPHEQPYYFNYQEPNNGLFASQHNSNYNSNSQTPSLQYQQPNSRYSYPIQQNFFDAQAPPPRQPIHNHNTRYSVSLNRPYNNFEGLFGQPVPRY